MTCVHLIEALHFAVLELFPLPKQSKALHVKSTLPDLLPTIVTDALFACQPAKWFEYRTVIVILTVDRIVFAAMRTAANFIFITPCFFEVFRAQHFKSKEKKNKLFGVNKLSRIYAPSTIVALLWVIKVAKHISVDYLRQCCRFDT